MKYSRLKPRATSERGVTDYSYLAWSQREDFRRKLCKWLRENTNRTKCTKLFQAVISLGEFPENSHKDAYSGHKRAVNRNVIWAYNKSNGRVMVFWKSVLFTGAFRPCLFSVRDFIMNFVGHEREFNLLLPLEENIFSDFVCSQFITNVLMYGGDARNRSRRRIQL